MVLSGSHGIMIACLMMVILCCGVMSGFLDRSPASQSGSANLTKGNISTCCALVDLV